MRKTTVLLLNCLLWSLAATGGLLGASETIRTVQQSLLDHGVDPGPVDGLIGNKTRQAIRDFQEKEGLHVSGRLDSETQKALGIDVPTRVTIPAGTRIELILEEPLSTKTNNQGDRFRMSVFRSVEAGGEVALPRRTVVWGHITELERAQRPQKGGRLVLRASAVETLGETIDLDGNVTADEARLKGKGSLKQDWKKIGIAAGVGAVIGGAVGGGKGVAAGLAIGAGGAFLATKGEHVNLPTETPLAVELTEAIEVPFL